MANFSLAKYGKLWLARHELDRYCWLLRMNQNSWLVFKIFIVSYQNYVCWYPDVRALFPVYVILKTRRNFLVFLCSLINFYSAWCLNLGSYAFPGLGPRPKVDISRPKWTHGGGVVRSKLHGLETRMNARWSGHERTKFWWTHESLVNARWSGHERTKFCWTHKSLVNARWSGHERTKVWTLTHKKFSCVHNQTFVRSCTDHRAFMSRPSCVHPLTFVR